MSVKSEHLVENYLHIGGLHNETSPTTRKFWDVITEGIVTLNVDLLGSQLEKMREKIQRYKKENKNVLILCEKVMLASEVEEVAKRNGFHYITTKVPSGFLTNFDTLIKRIEDMNKKKEFINSDMFEKMTKKEQSMMKRELRKVLKLYDGVTGLNSLPDLVVVIDGHQLKNTVREVEIKGIDNVILSSTNFRKWWNEDSLLVSNMQSYKSLSFIINYIFG